MPLGLGAGFIRRDSAGRRVAATVLCTIAAAVVFSTIEAGQFFLPTRTPDPTDVLTGTAGFYFGMRLVDWLRDTIRE